MSLIKWSAQLEVGVAVMDSDHQMLVAIVNELFDALREGKGTALLGEIFDRLVHYTVEHFGHEEALMVQHGFPGFSLHLKEHHDLTKEVLELQQRYRAGVDASFTLEVMNFLRDWLTRHIRESDHVLGAFLKAKGLK